MGRGRVDRGVQNKHCAIGMTRSGVRIKNNEDVCTVDDQLHTSDDLWGTRYYDCTRCIDGSKSPENVFVSENHVLPDPNYGKLTVAGP